MNRQGRYFARRVIPNELRRFMGGKTELLTPPWAANYRVAVRQDRIGIQAISPGDLRHRHIRRCPLKTDRPPPVISLELPRSTRHPQPLCVHDPKRTLYDQRHHRRGDQAGRLQGREGRLECGKPSARAKCGFWSGSARGHAFIGLKKMPPAFARGQCDPWAVRGGSSEHSFGMQDGQSDIIPRNRH